MKRVDKHMLNIFKCALLYKSAYIRGEFVIRSILFDEYIDNLEVIFRDNDEKKMFIGTLINLYKCEIIEQNTPDFNETLKTCLVCKANKKRYTYLEVHFDICDILSLRLDFTINALIFNEANGIHLCSFFKNYIEPSPVGEYLNCLDDSKNKTFSALPYKACRTNTVVYKNNIKQLLEKAERLLHKDYIMYSMYSNSRFNETPILFKNSANINKIKDLTNDQEKIKYNLNDICCICQSNFCVDELCIYTKCKHVFHKSCIFEMLETLDNDEPMSCIKCRSENFLL
tara:strand:+ start:1821 stop:2675 length:855 start_codon:yes stop_codon:yes gene_type:complete